jgi:hypothetical protein
VAARQLGNGAISRLTHIEWRVDRIEIVLTDEEHGQMMHGCEVHALVENAGLGRGVAEENHRDRGAILQHRSERGSDADRDRAADDRNAAEEIDGEIDEVHRAAFARGTAVDLAIELGEHRAQTAALADVVSVRTMGADHVVFRTQIPADAGGHRLLADAEMRGAAHVPFRVQRLDALLDPADLQHRAVEREALVTRDDRRLIPIDSAGRRSGPR